MSPDLTVDQLVEELLAWARDLPYPERDELPLWRWQRWMRESPDRAWSVLLQLLERAPDDPEVMDHVARQASLLISYDFPRFSPLVAGLLPASGLLASMIGPEVFVEGTYGPRYRSLDELASVWLRNNRHSAHGHRLRDLIREDSAQGLQVALEIIARAPLYGFDTDDVESPLMDCLRCHGPLVLSAIEAAAQDSIAVRRVIWSVRRLNPHPDTNYGIPASVWDPFQAAGGTTTTYNSELPPGIKTDLGAELEEMLEHWFVSEESFWAWSEVSDLVRENPERGWLAILAIVRQAETPQALCDCGCGPLEDLIRADPALFIERVEQAANSDHTFQDALACVWIKLENVPEPLARRYFIASGHMLSILDAPPDW